MNVSDKLTKVAENTIETFESGKKAQNAGIWDNFINSRTNNSGDLIGNEMFYNFPPDNFYPTRDLRPKTVASMFSNLGKIYDKKLNLKQRLEECGVQLDLTAHSGVTSYMFLGSYITSLPEISFTTTNSSTNLNRTFSNCIYLESIEKLVVKPNTISTNDFENCTSLTHIILEVINEGKIKGTWDFSYSPLDIESMKSIISCLFDYSGTEDANTYSVLFTEECWAALEAESSSPTGGTWEDYVISLGWLT